MDFEFTELNQSLSNDVNEQDIVEKSKMAQIGKFNSIDKGNASTVFYGGIVFPREFNYDDNNSRSCTNPKCKNMDYKIRFIQEYTDIRTDVLYSHTNGPSDAGI